MVDTREARRAVAAEALQSAASGRARAPYASMRRPLMRAVSSTAGPPRD